MFVAVHTTITYKCKKASFRGIARLECRSKALPCRAGRPPVLLLVSVSPQMILVSSLPEGMSAKLPRILSLCLRAAPPESRPLFRTTLSLAFSFGYGLYHLAYTWASREAYRVNGVHV